MAGVFILQPGAAALPKGCAPDNYTHSATDLLGQQGETEL